MISLQSGAPVDNIVEVLVGMDALYRMP